MPRGGITDLEMVMEVAEGVAEGVSEGVEEGVCHLGQLGGGSLRCDLLAGGSWVMEGKGRVVPCCCCCWSR